MYLNHQNAQIKTDNFTINTGIFQGDSPSGLLFILSLLALSWLLNTSNFVYRINHQGDIILHLLFMGNLKLFAGNQQYKYLGFGESLTTDKTTKLSLKNEYFKRLKMILKSKLSSKHIFEAINSYAILALLYGFPVLNRTITKLEIINRETRKMLQKYHVMHSQSDVT